MYKRLGKERSLTVIITEVHFESENRGLYKVKKTYLLTFKGLLYQHRHRHSNTAMVMRNRDIEMVMRKVIYTHISSTCT